MLQNGDRFYPAMLEAIRQAKDTDQLRGLHLRFGRRPAATFIEAFKERARAGRRGPAAARLVRLVQAEARGTAGELQDAGVKLEFFRPLALRNLVRMYRRTHRRAIVIDGRIGFTGGAAVSDKWKGNAGTPKEWRDSMTRVTGAAGDRRPVGVRRQLGLLLRRGDRGPAVLSR